MTIEESVIDELQDILSELYFKYGKDNEIIRLSCIIDSFIVKRQKEVLISWMNNLKNI